MTRSSARSDWRPGTGKEGASAPADLPYETFSASLELEHLHRLSMSTCVAFASDHRSPSTDSVGCATHAENTGSACQGPVTTLTLSRIQCGLSSATATTACGCPNRSVAS